MRKLLILLVASTLLLAGCSSLFGETSTSSPTPTTSASPSPTPEASIVVPDAVGLTDADAQGLIRVANLVVQWDAGEEIFRSGNWVVVSQVPAAGASAAPASTVTLTVERPTAQTPVKEPPVEAASDVQYRVTGDGGASIITYSDITDGKFSQAQTKEAKLPWSGGFDVPRAYMFNPATVSLSAVSSATSTKISCEIVIDGKSVSTDTATGPYGIAICTGIGSL